MIPPRTGRNESPARLEDGSVPAYMRPFEMSRGVFVCVFGVFCLASFLIANWFGLLLINSGGVVEQIGVLGALRVNAALMTVIAVTSVALMFHYRCLHAYESGENVFFAITFSLSFMMGFPCVLVGVFS